MRGALHVSTEAGGTPTAQIELAPSTEWKDFSGKLDLPDSVHELNFHFAGRGSFDLLEFTLS